MSWWSREMPQPRHCHHVQSKAQRRRPFEAFQDGDGLIPEYWPLSLPDLSPISAIWVKTAAVLDRRREEPVIGSGWEYLQSAPCSSSQRLHSGGSENSAYTAI